MAEQNGRRRDGRLERSWRRRVVRYESSGLTVREFCKREEVPETSFYHWRRELVERDRGVAHHRSASSSKQARRARRTSPLFLPVHVREGGIVVPADGVIEVRLPSGHVIRGGEVEKLAQLAVLLGGSTC